ncbi:transglutaminase-like cysteine peptidase [Neorhizobium sp. DT-125]|uniref:transglutaminase-like cysteine peptidase n=1 Tax=Neorhizobium sp. DT-125 TaxID=3396163 RepID=UPI003F1AB008
MIKKLIISAVVLTALIVGKEAKAAGVGGFARALSSVSAAQIHTSEVPAFERHDGAEDGVLTLTFAKRRELLRINSAVNGTIADIDGYLDEIAGDFPLDLGAGGCFDCADLKRDHLLSRGWPARSMRIAYAIDGTGRVERVLVIATDRGDVILGNDSPMIDMSGKQAQGLVPGRAPAVMPAWYDI